MKMYRLDIIWFIVVSLFTPKLYCEVSNDKNYGVHLKVYQTDDNGLVSKKNIKLTEGHVLNLTCTVEGANDAVLSWYVPSAMARSQHRLKDKEFEENRNLVISPISEVDSGTYHCEAVSHKGEHLQKESVRVLVEPDWGNCQPGFYNCNGTSPSKPYCIPKRYRCDGKPDCPMADDESELPCGFDPCKGKISCPELDFRCIDPSEHCCNPEEDFSCKVLPCCQAVLDYNNRSKDRHPPKGKKEMSSSSYDQIFYTAVGCCTVFLLVVALVFGLIKYQLFKTRNRDINRQRPPLTLHDLDLMYGGAGGGPVDPSDRNLSITLNINHGVQIMRPPPYSNRIDGPPPPYIQEEEDNPLLRESNNNNGDINGNSMADANNPNNPDDRNNRNLNQGIVLAEPVPAAQPNPPEVVGDNNSDPLGVNANNPHIQTERNITSTRSSATNGVAVNLHSETGSLGDGAGRSGQPGAAERPPPYEAHQDS